MEEYCGKTKEGKWVCYKCMGQDHTFRDKNKYDIHVNNNIHKRNFGEEIKSKKDLLQERNIELEARVKYLESKLEKALAENKELKMEKQIEERIRKEQSIIVQQPALSIPQNEIVKPVKIKKKDIGNPIKYLTETYPSPINMFKEIHNWKNGKDTGINEILENVTDIKSELIQIIEYFKGSFFYINEDESYAHDGKEWSRLYDNAMIDICFMDIINHLNVLYKEANNTSINGKEVYIEVLRQLKKICSL